MTSNLESNLFQNHQIPQSVTVLSKIMPDIQPNVLDAVLKLVSDTLTRKPVPFKSLDKLSKLGLSDNRDHLLSGLIMLTQAIVKLPQEAVKEDDLKLSLKELKFSDECSQDFVQFLQKSRTELCAGKLRIDDLYFHKIKDFNFRIDITISSNFLAKSLDTVIIFNIKFQNNETKVFEVSIAKFHQLRFYVASMLKELEFLEKKNIFKT